MEKSQKDLDDAAWAESWKRSLAALDAKIAAGRDPYAVTGPDGIARHADSREEAQEIAMGWGRYSNIGTGVLW